MRFSERAADPVFLISIDTEGDDVWAKPHKPTTRNARFLPRFQALCERHQLKPTYLTTWEMVNEPAFVDMAGDAARRGVAEIGMHMHAWDTPPLAPLGSQDWRDQPYAYKYSPALVASKARTVTEAIAATFGVAPSSHRAGRFGLDAAYARALAALGYRVDCSVTPGVSWTGHRGAPDGSGGPDFREFPTAPYWMDLDDIRRPGGSTLLQAPMTILPRSRPLWKELGRRALGRLEPRMVWLRPNGRNLEDLLFVLDSARRECCPYVQFTLHSSEFMPGGSPTFRSEASVETLYAHMETLFSVSREHFRGETLTGFAEGMRRERRRETATPA